MFLILFVTDFLTDFYIQIYSVDLGNADECSQAFRSNFYIGAIMFAGIVLANFLKPEKNLETDKEEPQREAAA